MPIEFALSRKLTRFGLISDPRIPVTVLTARLGQLPLRIATTELSVRCVYVEGPRAPFILGRADFLDRFVLTIDASRELIVLDAIGSSP